MLKSCIRPCEVLIDGRHLLVTKSFTFRHVGALQHLQQQVRCKSSRALKSQSAKKQQTPKATNKPKYIARETQKEILQRSHGISREQPKAIVYETEKEILLRSQEDEPGSKPILPSYSILTRNREDGGKYRPLLLAPVRPTPNQDLSSTRPAELEIPVRPKQLDVTYFYRLGKSYLTFYKTGLKNIWTNRKEYNEIRARLGSHSLEDAALYGGQLRSEHGKDRIPRITRREYQLCLRTRHDLGKLIPFGFVFAICGEFTPLVILALGSSVVPFTCRIPKQVQRDRRWFVKRLENTTADRFFNQVDASGDLSPRYGNTLAFMHGVSPVATLPPIIGPLFYHFWVKPRLTRRGFEILADTALIRREGGFGVLEPIEVFEYANKFFSLDLVWRSRVQLLASGEISWDPKMAATLGSELDEVARVILSGDWEHTPEQMRFRCALPYEQNSLAYVRAAEEEFKRTGEIPS